jgi:hypothetical protein
MSLLKINTAAWVLIVLSLLLMACSKNGDADAVADAFVRLYFVEDNVAEAAGLATGDARTKLDDSLREIEAAGGSEPAADKPRVKATLLETEPASDDGILYVYRVTSESEVEGMEPITAKLWLSKEGRDWRVKRFVQEE